MLLLILLSILLSIHLFITNFNSFLLKLIILVFSLFLEYSLHFVTIFTSLLFVVEFFHWNSRKFVILLFSFIIFHLNDHMNKILVVSLRNCHLVVMVVLTFCCLFLEVYHDCQLSLRFLYLKAFILISQFLFEDHLLCFCISLCAMQLIFYSSTL
jgi:hypothetical protein